MSSHQQSSRNPRFRRVKGKALMLTDRDRLIFEHLYRHRFLQTPHLVALTEAGQNALTRRLAKLYHAGYLDRPRAQIDYYRRGGSQAMVYALGDKGADVLAETLGVDRGKYRWSQKNRDVKRPFIEHTLRVSDVMVALELACRAHPSIRLISAEEILAEAPEATQARAKRGKNPFYWKAHPVVDGHRYEIGIVPDGVFGLHFTSEPEGRNRAYFFLEVDRATMSVEPRNLTKSSIYRKMTGYFESWKRGLHRTHFGIGNCRVLFVTTSQERIDSFKHTALRVLDEQRPPAKRGRVFLFAEQSAVTPASILTLDWQNALDERQIRLVD